MTPEKLARLFHETYEQVIKEGDNERKLNAWSPTGSKAWDEIPTMPRRVFIEVCRRVLTSIKNDTY